MSASNDTRLRLCHIEKNSRDDVLASLAAEGSRFDSCVQCFLLFLFPASDMLFALRHNERHSKTASNKHHTDMDIEAIMIADHTTGKHTEVAEAIMEEESKHVGEEKTTKLLSDEDQADNAQKKVTPARLI